MAQAREINRRRLLAAMAGSAAAAATMRGGLPRRGRALARGPRKVLLHDERHAGHRLSEGQAQGARVSPGGITGPGEFQGPVAVSPFPFTEAGVHWQAAGARDAAAFQARTSPDGSRWTVWQSLEVESAPHDGRSGEVFAALISAPRHRFLQYRASFQEGAGVEAVTTTFLNSLDGPLLASPAAADTAGIPFPLITREDWGADEGLRFQAGGTTEIWQRMYVPPQKAVIHHTATTNSYADSEAAKAQIRSIYTYHAVTQGWGDIGYNALIDRFGFVYEGRHGRDPLDTPSLTQREALSSGVVAGHALSHNYGSLGIAFLGTHTKKGDGSKPGVELTQESLDRLIQVLRFELGQGRNGIDPAGISDFLRSDDLWNRGLSNISGHRDCYSTICPGGYVYDKLPQVRDAVALNLNSGAPGVAITSAPPEETLAGGPLSYVWLSATPDTTYSYVLESWSRTPPQEEITYQSGFTAARRLAWPDWSATTAASYPDPLTPDAAPLPDGHYTFHVRAKAPDGSISYQQHRTLLLAAGSEPPPGPDPTSPPASLTASGYKVKGLQKVNLSWVWGAGASPVAVSVYRNGVPIAEATDGQNSYFDAIDAKGTGTYFYQLFASGSAVSNEATVTF